MSMNDIELAKFMAACNINCNHFIENLTIAKYCLKKKWGTSIPLKWGDGDEWKPLSLMDVMRLKLVLKYEKIDAKVLNDSAGTSGVPFFGTNCNLSKTGIKRDKYGLLSLTSKMIVIREPCHLL